MGLRGLRLLRLEGFVGRANGGCPSADLPGYGATHRVVIGGPRRRTVALGCQRWGSIPWRPGVRNTVILLGCLGGPESLTWHFLFFR